MSMILQPIHLYIFLHHFTSMNAGLTIATFTAEYLILLITYYTPQRSPRYFAQYVEVLDFAQVTIG